MPQSADGLPRDEPDGPLTSDEHRAYVRRWAQTGRLLEALRWRELAALSEERAAAASDALIEAALLVPVPDERRRWSGLADQQRGFHRKRGA
jgi:hypothetical protein